MRVPVFVNVRFRIHLCLLLVLPPTPHPIPLADLAEQRRTPTLQACKCAYMRVCMAASRQYSALVMSQGSRAQCTALRDACLAAIIDCWRHRAVQARTALRNASMTLSRRIRAAGRGWSGLRMPLVSPTMGSAVLHRLLRPQPPLARLQLLARSACSRARPRGLGSLFHTCTDVAISTSFPAGGLHLLRPVAGKFTMRR